MIIRVNLVYFILNIDNLIISSFFVLCPKVTIITIVYYCLVNFSLNKLF